jgi:hypothetical protein
MTTVPEARRFPIRIGRRSRLFLRCWGVRDGNAYVDLDGQQIDARFGWGRMTVPVANIVRWRIEGPWLWLTAIGIRMSIRHRDVSFQGSPRGGVRIDFREPVRWGLVRPPALYVGVEDLEGFAKALEELGIPGEDARTRRLP